MDSAPPGALRAPDANPGRRVRNDARRARTRQRLLDATIELIRAEGLVALTTTRIAVTAGVKQPNFYGHFKNVEECLREAADHVVGTVRRRSTELRRTTLTRLGAGEDLEDPSAVRALLDDWLTEPAFTELFLRHRLDQSVLGEAMQAIHVQAVEEFEADLWDVAMRLGIAGKQLPEVRALSEVVIGIFYTGLELYLSGKVRDRDRIATTVLVSCSGAVRAELTRLQTMGET